MFSRGGSFQLARIFGIRVGATPSWFLVLFVFIYFLTDYFGDVVAVSNTGAFVLAVIATLLFFGSIVLHELGHAIVARRNGIGIAGIELFFFGGVARLNREADGPGPEFRVAAAGPAVTLVVMAVAFGAGALAGHVDEVYDTARFADTGTVSAIEAMLGWLGVINAYLFVLNIIPAWPLDGGRIARAIGWKITGSREKATRIAARAGQGFAYLLMGFGVFVLISGLVDGLTGAWLLILGLFINQAARAELATSAFRVRADHLTVGDIMQAEPAAIPEHTSVLDAHDAWFRRYGDDWFPVTTSGGRFVGALRADWVDAAIAGGQPALPVAELLNEQARSYSIGRDRKLTDVLNTPALHELGGLAAVDAEGVLVGVVTLDRVRAALLQAASGPTGV